MSSSQRPLVGACVDGPGERTRLGYVRIWLSNPSRRVLAHRHAYEQAKGPIPDGMELDHLCRNRWCRNPDHLEPVTHRVNSQRSEHRKLDQAKADEIRRRYQTEAVTRPALATEFGVSRRAIDKVLSREFYP